MLASPEVSALSRGLEADVCHCHFNLQPQTLPTCMRVIPPHGIRRTGDFCFRFPVIIVGLHATCACSFANRMQKPARQDAAGFGHEISCRKAAAHGTCAVIRMERSMNLPPCVQAPTLRTVRTVHDRQAHACSSPTFGPDPYKGRAPVLSTSLDCRQGRGSTSACRCALVQQQRPGAMGEQQVWRSTSAFR